LRFFVHARNNMPPMGLVPSIVRELMKRAY
jgi:hypothetical protein